jgi:hypothetical protein
MAVVGGKNGMDCRACIYFYGYENGECGLRMFEDGHEIKFPDLWSAKVYGFMEWYRATALEEISEEYSISSNGKPHVS